MQDQSEELPASPARTPGPARPDTSVSWLAFAGVALIVIGLGLWALYRLGVGDERHSFARGAKAPATVELLAGHSYSIGIRDGVDTVRRRHIEIANLACEITPVGGAPTQLAIVADPADTKAINQIATFVSPETGRVHVDCPGLPAVFVDNAVDAGTDWSGTWLLLASASLAVGLPLLLSVLRRPRPYAEV